MGVYLPRWVWIGAALLACVSGMVNVVGYLSFEHQAVSHMSGTTTQLGIALAEGDLVSIGHLWGVLIAFSLGAMLSGMIIQDSTLKLGRRYGIALALESLLLERWRCHGLSWNVFRDRARAVLVSFCKT